MARERVEGEGERVKGGQAKHRSKTRLLRCHLIPAKRPPQPLPIECEERGGRQLAGSRLGAEADLDAPQHRARRQLDVLGLHVVAEAVPSQIGQLSHDKGWRARKRQR